MPPSHVLTDDVSSSSFVLSERTAPLHKGGGHSSLNLAGSPKKSKKALRRRSVDFVLTTSSSTAASSSSDLSSSPRPDPAPDGMPAPQASVHEYDGPTVEEQEEVWYSRDEYDIIKARNNLIIKMMKGGTFKESDEHTFRGLEHKLKDGFKRRRANKFNALNAVLEVQDSQFARGRPDPDSIAEAYRLVSLSAKETAFVLGNRDAEESYCYVGSSPTQSPTSQRTGKGKNKKVSSLSPSKGGSGRPRHSSLSDLLQHHQYHMGGTQPESGGNNDDNEDDDDSTQEVDDDDDDSSTVNDGDETVSSENTAKRRSRLRSMFGAVSLKRREKTSRRTSL